MSQLQCLFCSTSNPADAMACNACGRPLNRSAPIEGSVEYVSDPVPAGSEVVALEPAARADARKTQRFSRRALIAILGAGVLVAFGLLLYAPSHRPVQSTSHADGAAATQSATPAESAAPSPRSSTVQTEVGAPASPAPSPPAQQPATAERESTPLSLMEGMRRAAARGESAAAAQPVEPGPRAPTVRNTVAGSSNLGSTGGASAAATVTKNATGCSDGMAALGLCPAAPRQGPMAAGTASSPDTSQRPQKDDVNRGCTDAAAALALCTQTTTRGN